MKLSEFIKDNPSSFAQSAGIPIPVITRFLRGERGLSAQTMAKIVAFTGGLVSFEDLLAEMFTGQRGGAASLVPTAQEEFR